MAIYKIRCRLNFHYLGVDVFDVFAVGVADGVFGNPLVFMTPPATDPIFRGLITEYVNKRGAYRGGTAPRSVFLTAKNNLMAALDTMAEYVNTVAAGNTNTITLAGFEATKGNNSQVNPPSQPQNIVVKRGISGELLAECPKIVTAVFYGAFLLADNPLPDNIMINEGGQIVINEDAPVPPEPVPLAAPAASGIRFILDLNKSRKKRFIGLTKGVTYYIYFYAGNAGGTSPLSEGTGLDPV